LTQHAVHNRRPARHSDARATGRGIERHVERARAGGLSPCALRSGKRRE
jgi:hypothetical protein